MELKKKSWRDVSINEYFDLKEKLDDGTLNEYDKEVIKLAFITEQDEDKIWSLSINEFRALQVQSLWMQEFPISDNPKFSTIKINKETYNIDTNLQNFTIAQYIDFQSFYSKRKSNERVLGNILACFIIPKGHKYAEGYDIQELVSTLNNNLDILTANEIMFFFSQAISNFNKGFSELFQLDDEKTEEEIEEPGAGEGSGRALGENEESYFGWLALIDNVGELTRDKWDDVFKKNIYEFFNLVSYLQYKSKKQKDQIEKWKQSH